ncbi:MAG: hypothetical protein WEB07_00095, partial [Natronospirillum sp.]
MVQRIFWLSSVIFVLSAWLVWHTAAPARVDSGVLQVAWQADQTWTVPGLAVRWDASVEQLSIHDNQSQAWASSPGQSWLGAGYVDEAKTVGLRNARNPMRQLVLCSSPSWTQMEVMDGAGNAYLRLNGTLHCALEDTLPVVLDMHPLPQGGVSLQWAIDGPVEFSFLDFERAENERFSGFGAQTKALSVSAGRKIMQPRSASSPVVDATAQPKPAHSWDDPLTEQSDAGAWPVVMSTASRALLAEADGSLVLDLQVPNEVRIESWGGAGGQVSVRADASPKALSTWIYSLQSGPQGLPGWASAQAIVGTSRRGTELDALLLDLQAMDTPVSQVLLERAGQPMAWLDWPTDSQSAGTVPLPGAFPHPGQPWPPMVTLPDLTAGWGPQSGLQGSLTALLAAGVSGMSIVHAPVGGTRQAQQLWWRSGRSGELFLRWLELNTFTAWLRLHEGDVPAAHFQMTDSAGGQVHFYRMAKLYEGLASYRTRLTEEAVEH